MQMDGIDLRLQEESLYPNVMISLNMSPETKVGKIIESDRVMEQVKVEREAADQFKKAVADDPHAEDNTKKK
jgi:hypothetical protein